MIEGDGGDYLKLVADPSLAPPLLTPEGAKVQPDWLYAFLRGPITIPPVARRPHADVRPHDDRPERRDRYFGAVSNTIGRSRLTKSVAASD